VIMDYSW